MEVTVVGIVTSAQPQQDVQLQYWVAGARDRAAVGAVVGVSVPWMMMVAVGNAVGDKYITDLRTICFFVSCYEDNSVWYTTVRIIT